MPQSQRQSAVVRIPLNFFVNNKRSNFKHNLKDNWKFRAGRLWAQSYNDQVVGSFQNSVSCVWIYSRSAVHECVLQNHLKWKRRLISKCTDGGKWGYLTKRRTKGHLQWNLLKRELGLNGSVICHGKLDQIGFTGPFRDTSEPYGTWLILHRKLRPTHTPRFASEQHRGGEQKERGRCKGCFFNIKGGKPLKIAQQITQWWKIAFAKTWIWI